MIFILAVGFNQSSDDKETYRPKRMHVFLLVPNLCAFIYTSAYDICKPSKSYEGEALVSLLKFVMNLAFNILMLDISLKLDDRLGWTWSQAFFPFWIIFSILITITLVSMSVFMTVLCPMLTCKSKDWRKLPCFGWINLNLIGALVFGALVQMELVRLLDNKEVQEVSSDHARKLTMSIVYALIFALLMLIATVLLSRLIR